MKVEALKEKFLDSIDMWLEERIDDMLKNNPTMAIPSVYIKRGCHNLITKNKCNISNGIDTAALFFADEEGNINTETVFADMMGIFKAMEEQTFDMGFVSGIVGKGKVSITLPDNIFTNIIFGSKKTLCFGETDFMELKSLICK